MVSAYHKNTKSHNLEKLVNYDKNVFILTVTLNIPSGFTDIF